MKASVVVLLAVAPLMMTACSKTLGNGISVQELTAASSQALAGDDFYPAEVIDGSTSVVPVQPGQEIDPGGNLVDSDSGDVVIPACAASSAAVAAANYAGITQHGSNNEAIVYQSGSGNVACILQEGDNNHASVTQVGTGNTATVIQR